MLPANIHDTLLKALAIAAVQATLYVTDGDAQTRQLIRIKAARDALDRLQTQPVWEPLADGEYLLAGDDLDGVIVTVSAYDEYDEAATIRVYAYGETAKTVLPSDMRLCRLVQQQPQEGQSHE